MADRAAEMLGLSDTKVLEVLGSLADGKPYGIGLSGSLPEEMTLMELARRVKETFNIPHVSVFGDLDSGKKLKCAAICPGSGGSEIELALGAGAEVYITGDISHHEGLDAAERGLAVIDAGHYGIEHIFMPIMEKYLGKVLPKEIKIRRAADIFPQKVV
jgi:putative NIF3 family GTP cyclohydrolase 1 type 2